ncbi:MAG: superoxide dismutase [Simkaniaceae bacterium]|nr:superoxide dismutase [Simkaniaceae bacterium]
MAEKYKLPDLGYDFNALAPVISGEIMELHYTKHHQGYVTKLNEALEQYEAADVEGKMKSLQALKFNGGGHINHSIFWTNLAPVSKGGGEPPAGALKQAIEETWGSLEGFIEKFNTMTVGIQGSGWGWLGLNSATKKLCMHTCPNQDPLCSIGLIPLLGVDVWEHAYYLQYKSARLDYLKNIWKVIDWKNVASRYNSAK